MRFLLTVFVFVLFVVAILFLFIRGGFANVFLASLCTVLLIGSFVARQLLQKHGR